MKKLRWGAVLAVALAAPLAFVPSAQAAKGRLVVVVGTATCQYTASVAGGARADNHSCARVGAQTQYISAAGGTGWTAEVKHPTTAIAPVPSGVTYFSGRTAGAINVAGMMTYVWQTL